MNSARALFALALAAALGTSYVAFAALGGSSGVRIPYHGVLERDGVMVSGNVDTTFAVFNQETGGSACYTSSPIDTEVTSGRFSVVIGPITPESCVKGQDVWVEVSVDDGTGLVVLGRQRILPAIAANSSGSGDFDVGGALTVTGAASASSLSVSGATSLGSLDVSGATTTATLTTTDAARVGGDLTVTGHVFAGYYRKSCGNATPGYSGHCACNATTDRILGGGADCDVGNTTYLQYSHATSDTNWYASCRTAAGAIANPAATYITCARLR